MGKNIECDPRPFFGPPEGRVFGLIDPRPFFGPPEGRVFGLMIRDPSLDRPKVEFSGLNHVDGLDAPT